MDDLERALANLIRNKVEADIVDRAMAERARFAEALVAILEEAEDREDVEDGSDGRPRTNAWMRVATLCREALGK